LVNEDDEAIEPSVAHIYKTDYTRYWSTASKWTKK
jgi:hypothetical protein